MNGRSQRWSWRLLWLSLVVGGLACAGSLFIRLVPLPPALDSPPPPSQVLTDRNGAPLRLSHSSENPFQLLVRPGEIPQNLAAATVAVEDRRFWNHRGVDALAILRATGLWFKEGRIVSGGSTITQQLIKSCQPRARTFWPKLKEAVQAVRLEQLWSKERILAEYLNRIEYGNQCQGAEEAARYYFGKRAGQLEWAEAAFLAGLPQAPSRYNPHRYFERAKNRQRKVLSSLAAAGIITARQAEEARTYPIGLKPPSRPFQAPHFVDLLHQVHEDLGIGGNQVATSLDLPLNLSVQSLLTQHLKVLAQSRAKQGAVVVLENRTGEILCLVGSADYWGSTEGQVNAAWAGRSAGSTLKPFTYLLALERGDHAATVIPDIPSYFETPTGTYVPWNYDRRFRGPVRYREALANSWNIPAVRVLDKLGGPRPLWEFLRKTGLTTLTESPDHYGLGLTIGNAEVRLLELVNAYATLARLGESIPYSFLHRATPPRSTRLASADACWMIADILADNAARAASFGAESELRFDYPVACKTGTSSDFRDNWAIGFTPEYTVGVWVGNYENRPMQQVSGVAGAAPVLHAVFEELRIRQGLSWYVPPPEIRMAVVHPLTGKRLRHSPGEPLNYRDGPQHPEVQGCPGILERFLPSSLPQEVSDADYGANGKVFLPVEYADWATSRHNTLADRVSVRLAPTNDSRLEITYPTSGTAYVLDPDLPRAAQWIPLRATPKHVPIWSSSTLVCSNRNGVMMAKLQEGKHHLVAQDPGSRQTAETWIQVKRR